MVPTPQTNPTLNPNPNLFTQPPKGLSPRECHYVATSVPRTACFNERQDNESEPIATKRTVRTSVECWGVTNDRELSGTI